MRDRPARPTNATSPTPLGASLSAFRDEGGADPFAGGRTQTCSPGVVRQQTEDRGAEPPEVPGIGQQHAGAGGDLVGDAADGGADDRAPLPHRLATVRPNPSARLFLRHDRRVPLQCVDHGRVLVDVVQRERDQHGPYTHRVRQGLPEAQAFGVHGRTLRVVRHLSRRRPYQGQTPVGVRRDVPRSPT
jgi:hypothetical protein